ncbi:MAG TPA: hypothetical protein VGM29_12770 [Polyangiaceae bacterium]
MRTPAVGPTQASAIAPRVVDDQAFAEQLYQVLVTSDDSPARASILVGVVQRQLAHAKARFDAGQRDAGLAALTGAFYLMRAGEFRREAIDGSAPVLREGAAEVARRGRDGYAFTLYGMLRERVPAGSEQREVDGHLDAMARFSKAMHSKGPMQSASADLKAAIERSLLDTSPGLLEAARDRTVSWLRLALESNAADSQIKSSADRDEAFEAYRALRGGGLTLVALYLRHGDPRGALESADHAELGRIITPDLRDRLSRASEGADADAWNDLFQFFDSTQRLGRADEIVDSDLMAAAAWGSALELFRSEPGSLRGTVPLAGELINHGMAEAAPLVLTPALSKDAGADNVSYAMNIVAKALVSEDELDQLASARRTFEHAQLILAQAESKANIDKVQPSAARLRYVMGALETRHGDLARALPLVRAAAAAEPSFDALMTLASIERQQSSGETIGTLEKAADLARGSGDALAESDALNAEYEVYRDRGDGAHGAVALNSALARVVDALKATHSGPGQAHAERLLARILEHYGDTRGTRRATERAYEASNNDPRQLTATVLDAARRALTYSDLKAARVAAQRALQAGLGPDDLVYVALWLQLVERRLGVPSDGTAEEAFAAIDDNAGWPAKLRAWARGRLSDQELAAAAHDASERTEALFYGAMAKLSGGHEMHGELEQVAKSSTIDLVEVTIARDLLAMRAHATTDLKLPPNVVVP